MPDMDKFAALGEPTRRRILEMLADRGELPASTIAEAFQVSPSAISQHLKALREADLVLMEKRAQQRIYRINPAALQELESWTQQMRQLWSRRFDALDALLKEEIRKGLEAQDGDKSS
jgi:DNA-binding transcriptional ArsR family regulator